MKRWDVEAHLRWQACYLFAPVCQFFIYHKSSFQMNSNSLARNFFSLRSFILTHIGTLIFTLIHHRNVAISMAYRHKHTHNRKQTFIMFLSIVMDDKVFLMAYFFISNAEWKSKFIKIASPTNTADSQIQIHLFSAISKLFLFAIWWWRIQWKQRTKDTKRPML